MLARVAAPTPLRPCRGPRHWVWKRAASGGLVGLRMTDFVRPDDICYVLPPRRDSFEPTPNARAQLEDFCSCVFEAARGGARHPRRGLAEHKSYGLRARARPLWARAESYQIQEGGGI